MAFAAAALAAIDPARAQQVLRVGLQGAEPGVVRSNNEIGGLQIEVVEAIAKYAGFKVTFTITENSRRAFVLMDEGKLDVVAATTVTAENQANYSFTVGYGTTAEALVVPKTDTQQYLTIADAKALTLVTLRGSPYASYLKRNGIINYKEVETTTDALMAVSTGQVEASLFSGVISGYVLKQGLFPNLQVVASYQPALARPYALAFPKHAGEILTKTNASIQKLNDEGTIRQIFSKYGLAIK
jgi:ABC-type amino acid transport substrate-binding protein